MKVTDMIDTLTALAQLLIHLSAGRGKNVDVATLLREAQARRKGPIDVDAEEAAGRAVLEARHPEPEWPTDTQYRPPGQRGEAKGATVGMTIEHATLVAQAMLKPLIGPEMAGELGVYFERAARKHPGDTLAALKKIVEQGE